MITQQVINREKKIKELVSMNWEEIKKKYPKAIQKILDVMGWR